MPNIKIGVGTQDISVELIWGGTPHIRIGLDTAHYSKSGGDTAQENVFSCSHRGGD